MLVSPFFGGTDGAEAVQRKENYIWPFPRAFIPCQAENLPTAGISISHHGIAASGTIRVFVRSLWTNRVRIDPPRSGYPVPAAPVQALAPADHRPAVPP